MQDMQVFAVELFCGGDDDDGTVRVSMYVPNSKAEGVKPALEEFVDDLIADPSGTRDKVVEYLLTEESALKHPKDD